LERARQGDEQAFAELGEAYQRPVFNRTVGDGGGRRAQESFL
jgi:hypothetical protein